MYVLVSQTWQAAQLCEQMNRLGRIIKMVFKILKILNMTLTLFYIQNFGYKLISHM